MQLLKAAAYYTKKCNGNSEQIKMEYAQELNRELNEEVLETIEYFVNGYV